METCHGEPCMRRQEQDRSARSFSDTVCRGIWSASALTTRTEAAIMDSINHLHGKKTLVIIAHRLQTIEKCDMVYRVEEGSLGER